MNRSCAGKAVKDGIIYLGNGVVTGCQDELTAVTDV